MSIIQETSKSNIKDQKVVQVDVPSESYKFQRPKDTIFFLKLFSYLPISIIVIFSLIIRLWAAQESEGFVHPDEVFQSIEMVHYWLKGTYGIGQTIPWEYNPEFEYGGARSWFFVIILVALYKFLMLFGINDPYVLIYFARVFLSLTSIITVLVAYYFGKEAFNKEVGLLSSFLCGIWWFLPFWSSRTMTDSISSDFLFLSIFLVYKTFKTQITKKKLIFSSIAGFSLGLAFMIRFPSAMMGFLLAGAYIIMAFKQIHDHYFKITGRKLFSKNPIYKRESGGILKVVGIKKIAFSFIFLGIFCLSTFYMVIAQGLLDLTTWGSFLQSPINFFMYNVVEGKSANHGVAPWYAYIAGLFTDFASYFLSFFVLFLALGFSFNEKNKTKIYLFSIIIYWIAVFSLLAHKEFRFVMTIIPVGFILVGYGIYKFIMYFQKKAARYSLLALILIVITLSSSYMAFLEKSYMWKWNSGICNAMYYVGQQEDSNRLIVCEMVWYTGGYAYLDKNIPCSFIRINLISPYSRLNTTEYNNFYKNPGTYVIIRATEYTLSNVYDINFHEFFISKGLVLVAIIGENPNAYVYKSTA